MACTEWTTSLVYSQTCEPINFSQSPQLINSRTNTLVSSLTCQLVILKQCQLFSNKFNIRSALFLHQPANLAAKNRFSRRFVSMQNRVSLRMMQNEYLFQGNAIYTNFRAIFCKI